MVEEWVDSILDEKVSVILLDQKADCIWIDYFEDQLDWQKIVEEDGLLIFQRIQHVSVE